MSHIGALAIFGRFLYYYETGHGRGHIQSLILGAILAIGAFQVIVIGILGDLLAANRRLLERVLVRVRRLELALEDESSHELELTAPEDR